MIIPWFSSHFPTFPNLSQPFPTFPHPHRPPFPPVAQPGAARASGPPCARSPGRSKGAAPAVSPAPGVQKIGGGLLILLMMFKVGKT